MQHMVLSRFNKYLIKKGLAKLSDNKESVQLIKMFNSKFETSAFKKNEVLLKRYFTLRKIDSTKASSLIVKNTLLFY